jgi:hypothetical protein
MKDKEDCLLALALVILRRRRRRKQDIKPRRFWICDAFRHRKTSGEFHNLVCELSLGDQELYFR